MTRRPSGSLGIAIGIGLFWATSIVQPLAAGDAERALSLTWDKEILTIHGKHLPGGALEVWYIEAFCRPGSTRRLWKQTVIPHKTLLVESGRDGRLIKLRSNLDDGVVVEHEIRVGVDEVDFRVVATNPTDRRVAGAIGRSPASASIATQACSRNRPPDLPAALFHLRRWQAGAIAHCPMGPRSALHSRAGLVSGRRQPRRCQSAAAQRDHSFKWSDRLRLG